jgi:hypothetical protein
MIDDADATFWLSLIAIASIVQVLLVIAAAGALLFAVARLRARLDEIQRTQVAPLVARGHQALDRVEDTVAHVRDAAARVRARASPLVGLVRGLGAAVSTLANGRDRKARGRRHADMSVITGGR